MYLLFLVFYLSSESGGQQINLLLCYNNMLFSMILIYYRVISDAKTIWRSICVSRMSTLLQMKYLLEISGMECQSLTGTFDSRRHLITSVAMDLSLTISGYSFSITRDSADGSYPLISTLTVPNLTFDLSGTRVNRTGIGSSLAETSSTVATIFSM